MPIIKAKEKISRRLGVNLFLKGERSMSQKSAMTRRPYPPGQHGKTFRRRSLSEFGQQLAEKQKLRYSYGLKEISLRRAVERALERGNVESSLLEELEFRLDNIVFRAGFALSRSIARQLVSHGHVLLDGKYVTIPSHLVRVGQVVSLSPAFSSSPTIGELRIRINKFNPPAWLALDKGMLAAKVVRKPHVDEIFPNVRLSAVIEYYAR